MARQGVAVLLVDFRNCMQGHESVPEVAQFPAGLNDCYSSLQWLNANKGSLHVSDAVCVTGDSGGGNLCLAVGMKALRQSELHMLPSGIFSMCPFIDGHSPMGYSQKAFDARDPLAWPSFATAADLRGMPRTTISVNELDGLAAEGIAFHAVLEEAGVETALRVVEGTQHATEVNNSHAVPDIAVETARALADFCADGAPLKRMDMPAFAQRPKL